MSYITLPPGSTAHELSVAKIDLGNDTSQEQAQIIQLALPPWTCNWALFQDDASKLIVQHFEEDQSTELVVYDIGAGEANERARLKFDTTCFDEDRPFVTGLRDHVAFLAGPRLYSPAGGLRHPDPGAYNRE